MDELAVDLLEFATGGALEGLGGDAVEAAQAATIGLVVHGDGVGAEDRGAGSGALETVLEVLGGVVDVGLAEVDEGVDARPERAVAGEVHAVVHLGQPDEHERQEGARVPLVVGEDVQVIEHVLMQQVGLVEQEDRVDALLAQLLDVTADLVEGGSGGGLGAQAQGQAPLAVEVAPPLLAWLSAAARRGRCEAIS